MTSWVVASKVYTPKVNELIDLLEYKKLKNLGKMATQTFDFCTPMDFSGQIKDVKVKILKFYLNVLKRPN